MKWLSQITVLALVAVVAPVTSAQAEMRLLFVEEEGCIYCQRWKHDVGTEYPVTPEGRAAPLMMIDVRSDELADYELASRPRLTPTFILVENKVELQRLEGYPGEDFFWGLLGQMLEREGVELMSAPQ